MSPPLLRGRRRVRQQLAGVAFIAVIASLVGGTVGLYRKSFTDVTTVYVEADRIGNQLGKGGDVKARGVIVGEVRGVTSNGRRARIELALDPAQAARLPSDLRVQMLPKTLFGEKFVSLVVDDDSTARPLREGDVVAQDRSETARETSEALDDLLPLLQALRPQDLSVTLNALSGALRGRGERLGQDLELTGSYLRGFNPELPTLSEDFRGTADFANTLTQATPDVVGLLDNSSALSRDLVQTEPELSTFLQTTAASSDRFGRFLEDNDDRLIRLAADSLPSLQLYERYAPEYPCLTKAIAQQHDELGVPAFGGNQPGLHITVEFISDQGGYRPGDEPVYGEKSGPTCRGLPPNAPIRPFPIDMEVTDGYCDDQEQQPGVQTECQGRDPQPFGGASVAQDPARALARRDLDRAAVAAVAGPVLGLAPDDVPDLAVLLFGPVARGTAVGLR